MTIYYFRPSRPKVSVKLIFPIIELVSYSQNDSQWCIFQIFSKFSKVSIITSSTHQNRQNLWETFAFYTNLTIVRILYRLCVSYRTKNHTIVITRAQAIINAARDSHRYHILPTTQKGYESYYDFYLHASLQVHQRYWHQWRVPYSQSTH